MKKFASFSFRNIGKEVKIMRNFCNIFRENVIGLIKNFADWYAMTLVILFPIGVIFCAISAIVEAKSSS